MTISSIIQMSWMLSWVISLNIVSNVYLPYPWNWCLPNVNEEHLIDLLATGFEAWIMAEDLDKPLLDPENFNRDGIDLVGFH